VGVVPEPVEQGGGQLLVAKDLYPRPEREVGGYESATDFVSFGDEVEEAIALEARLNTSGERGRFLPPSLPINKKESGNVRREGRREGYHPTGWSFSFPAEGAAAGVCTLRLAKYSRHQGRRSAASR
jgi:hypothetical protein